MNELTVQENKRLSEVCTFGIGGPARYFIEVRSVDQAREAFAFASSKEMPIHILGKGSNTLFDDQGFNGLVILNKIDFCSEIAPGKFHVGAGYSFSLLGAQTARQGWSGLEFASGIPASVGGAVYMNAGANGTETSKTLEAVDFLDYTGNARTYAREQLSFAYRTSVFQKLPGIITGATFLLQRRPEARQEQLEIIQYRKMTQPYSDKSAGCIFRNPENKSAGSLIDQAGLKGLSIGGAKVSEKHANFIVNTQNATSRDIHALIEEVRLQVREKSGVELESEVRYIPYDVRSSV